MKLTRLTVGQYESLLVVIRDDSTDYGWLGLLQELLRKVWLDTMGCSYP